MSATNKATIRMRKLYPDMPLIVRAKNQQHKSRLEGMFDNVVAMAPVLPEDSVLLTLPFAGAVLRNIGVSRPEIEALMEETRKVHLEDLDDSGDERVLFGLRVDRRKVGAAGADGADADGDDSGEGIMPIDIVPSGDALMPDPEVVEAAAAKAKLAGVLSGDAFDITILEMASGILPAEELVVTMPGMAIPIEGDMGDMGDIGTKDQPAPAPVPSTKDSQSSLAHMSMASHVQVLAQEPDSSKAIEAESREIVEAVAAVAGVAVPDMLQAPDMDVDVVADGDA
jgi:hypothetical protein